MSDETTISIACAADAAYALPLATMLKALAANLSPQYRVEAFVLDDGLSPEDKKKVAQSVSQRVLLHWRPSHSLPTGLPVWGRMSKTTYQKLTLGSWLPG